MSNNELTIQAIDSRVRRLEATNDSYIARYGRPNEGIMELINKLMDEREELRFHKS